MKNVLMNHRGRFKWVADLVIWTMATAVAYLFRLDGDLSGFESQVLYLTGVLFVVKTVLVSLFATHRQSWRNTGFHDLFWLAIMVAALTVPYCLMVVFFRPSLGIPLSIPLMEGLLAFMFLTGTRAITRFLIKYRFPRGFSSEPAKRVLIAGAGESGTMVAREMLKSNQEGLKPVAFVDDDPFKQNSRVMGIPVRGTVRNLASVVQNLQIDEIIIAMPSESGEVIRRVVAEARKTDASYRIIPAIYDLLSGRISINQLRKVDVEDLLRRKPVQLETQEIQDYITGKRVLVSGAGGSIGSEIVRQISRFDPKHVILLGRGENSIHQLVREFQQELPDLNYCVRIGDVRDYPTVQKILSDEKPEVIFHAAAHKHVPLMEENPAQAIFNNVMGTRNLVNLAVDYGVQHFVNISTDKAVNPTSVMGASKRIAEHIVEWGASQSNGDKVYVSVRFGNVLGSRGSVIPIFKNQIKKGGPVTVTHRDMIRYFMTIPEAAQLVLQAGALNHNGAVYVLDMGDPVNIEQMARDLIRLCGYEPDKEIEIVYTGMRPGEKLFEELLTAEEGTDITKYDKIFMARKNGVLPNLTERLDRLYEVASEGDAYAIREEIYNLVPTYSGAQKADV